MKHLFWSDSETANKIQLTTTVGGFTFISSWMFISSMTIYQSWLYQVFLKLYITLFYSYGHSKSPQIDSFLLSSDQLMKIVCVFFLRIAVLWSHYMISYMAPRPFNSSFTAIVHLKKKAFLMRQFFKFEIPFGFSLKIMKEIYTSYWFSCSALVSCLVDLDLGLKY